MHKSDLFVNDTCLIIGKALLLNVKTSLSKCETYSLWSLQIEAVFMRAEKVEFEYEFSPPQLCELPKPMIYPPPIPPLAAAMSSTREPDREDHSTTEKTKHFEGNPVLDATRMANLFIKNGLILPLGIRRARW